MLGAVTRAGAGRLRAAAAGLARHGAQGRVRAALVRDMGEQSLTHVDSTTGLPRMVDVGTKTATRRSATARSTLVLPPQVLEALQLRQEGDGHVRTVGADLHGPKGPVFSTAVVAGVLAAKSTSSLIPFCHPLPVEKCDVQISVEDDTVLVDCTVSVTHKTGVEMEALVGASVAALTVYDMLKALSHDIVIADTRLLHKSGGKSGTYARES